MYGKTPLKDNPNILCERYIANDAPIASAQDLQHIVNKIYLACVLCEYDVGANQGALKLDACLKRYCRDWTDHQREEFIFEVVQRTDPESRDCTKKCKTIFVLITKKQKTCYIFTTYWSRSTRYQKSLEMIGSVPDSDAYEKVKSIVDFNEKAIDMHALRQTIFDALRNAVSPILPEGFVGVAGRPKAMKSFTLLLLAYCVQNGFKFMGHETLKGDVLYLALEDSERRIKDRERKLGVEKWDPPQIYLQKMYLILVWF